MEASFLAAARLHFMKNVNFVLCFERCLNFPHYTVIFAYLSFIAIFCGLSSYEYAGNIIVFMKIKALYIVSVNL